MRTAIPLLTACLMSGSVTAADPSRFPDLKITTRADWEAKRKPELKAQFERLMYGRYPTPTVEPTAQVVHENAAAFDGAGTLREVAIRFGADDKVVHLLVVTPNGAKGKVPVFLGLMFGGNHQVTDDPKVRIPTAWMYPSQPGTVKERATEAGRGKSQGVWPVEAILKRGYAVALFYAGEIVPDNPKLRGGLSDLTRPVIPDANDRSGTGAVMAWAWGAHRMIDYLVTLPEIDAGKIAVVGHSRLGKATIVAAAFDDRVALAIPNQAGCGGTAPDRRTNPKSEPIERITTAFPHWFAPEFARYGGERANELPFDQHALVALCAPRPVLFTNATEDQWADPPGQFEVLRAANPAYDLYGVRGMTAAAMPAENTLVGETLGYWVRPGKHAMTTADWDTYLTFADRKFGR